jgi:Fe-S cluster assembly protein SufB/Fe-S cluster assembly protein SufD
MYTSQQIMGSFSEELVRSISDSLGEPKWLLESRLTSFRHFLELPSEVNPLYTKYSGVSEFDITKFTMTAKSERIDFRSFFKDYLTGKERNILLQGNEVAIHSELEEQLRAQGILLVSIADAIRDHESSIRPLFETRMIKSEKDRYAAFVNAFFNSGTLVKVPKGVKAGLPVRKMLLTGSATNPIVEQIFIDVGEDSKLVFLEELYSREGEAVPMVASNVEIRSRPNSSLDFSTIQLLDPKAVHTTNRAIETLDGSRVTVSSLSLGSSVSRSRMNFLLNGRGSFAEGFEIFFTDASQRYDFETNLLHNSPDSTGSTQARGVLKGASQSIFKGMIKIVNSAKNSRSYLAHHAMILERTAKSDGIPGLEIDNNEVKATHSASVAEIDEEQVFYLMARGLPRDEAKKMIVLGFFEPVLSRIPIEQTREGARFMIEGKWNRERRRLVDRETLLALTGETTPEVKESEDIFERHYKYR